MWISLDQYSTALVAQSVIVRCWCWLLIDWVYLWKLWCTSIIPMCQGDFFSISCFSKTLALPPPPECGHPSLANRTKFIMGFLSKQSICLDFISDHRPLTYRNAAKWIPCCTPLQTTDWLVPNSQFSPTKLLNLQTFFFIFDVCDIFSNTFWMSILHSQKNVSASTFPKAKQLPPVWNDVKWVILFRKWEATVMNTIEICSKLNIFRNTIWMSFSRNEKKINYDERFTKLNRNTTSVDWCKMGQFV